MQRYNFLRSLLATPAALITTSVLDGVPTRLYASSSSDITAELWKYAASLKVSPALLSHMRDPYTVIDNEFVALLQKLRAEVDKGLVTI